MSRDTSGSHIMDHHTGIHACSEVCVSLQLMQTLLLVLQELLSSLDGARSHAHAAATRRASLANDAHAAEEQAAVAKRRVPELEAKKKAAAAARDFKEAARLSAEAKQLAAAAEASAQRAQQLQAEVWFRTLTCDPSCRVCDSELCTAYEQIGDACMRLVLPVALEC